MVSDAGNLCQVDGAAKYEAGDPVSLLQRQRCHDSDVDAEGRKVRSFSSQAVLGFQLTAATPCLAFYTQPLSD